MHTIIYRMGFVLGWLPSEHYVRDIFLITLSAAIAATLLSIRFYLRITAGRCFTEVNQIHNPDPVPVPVPHPIPVSARFPIHDLTQLSHKITLKTQKQTSVETFL